MNNRYGFAYGPLASYVLDVYPGRVVSVGLWCGQWPMWSVDP